MWVEVADDLGSNVEICVYYNKSGESSVSNGTNCLLPNTLLYSYEGIKQINSIKAGELVFTHKGRYEKILEVLKRPYKGEMIKVTPYHLPSISFTPEHPIYAIKASKCPSHFGVSKDCERICRIESCRYRDREFCQRLFENYEPEWCFADELEKGDYVLLSYPIKIEDKTSIKISDYVEDVIVSNSFAYSIGRNQYGKIFKHPNAKGISNEIYIDTDFLRVVGYYLAEGFITENTVRFAFGSHESEYIEDLQELAQSLFGLQSSIKKEGSKTLIIIYSKVLASLFSQLFGKGAKNKHLPEFMMCLSQEKQFSLLKGLFRGDGCIHNSSQQKINYVTISLDLSYQIFMLLLRQGILSSFKKVKREEYDILGYKGKARDYYKIEIFNDYAEIFGQKNKEQKKREPKRGLIKNGYAVLPIRKIERIPYEGIVYNLEVENDNSYNTLSMSIHNCFEFFDDFEDGDGAWVNPTYAPISTTRAYSGTHSRFISVVGAVCYIDIPNWPDGSVLEYWFNQNVAGSQGSDGQYFRPATGATYNAQYYGTYYNVYYDSAYYTLGGLLTLNTWYLAQVYYSTSAGGSLTPWRTVFNGADTGWRNSGIITQPNRFGVAIGVGSAYFDVVRVRKYASPEPAFSSAGSEESLLLIPRHGFVNFQIPGIV